ncbi:MAG TPA: MaoC/PaaZ C-terminal domain-containing protein [Actinomycetota bacterium]|jgi:acyl dehydratase
MSELRPRFGDLFVGYEIPGRATHILRRQIKTYADASGDQNPLHQDDDFARAVGFPGIIAHGMLTMGELTHCLTDWLGDAAVLVRLKVQFRAPVFVDDVIVAEGRVKSVDPKARTAVLDVWVRVEREGNTEYPIRKGEAVVGFAER